MNAFLLHLEWWLPSVLRQKALNSASEEQLLFIGAADLATMLCDYVLAQLADDPDSCWTTCQLDDVTNENIMARTAFTPELLAAALIGAVVDLSEWQGESGYSFLVHHHVPAEDARQFTRSVEVVSEKLGERGQALIQLIDRVAHAAAARPRAAVVA